MPEIIKKEDGIEVEVFTQEELETQSQSAIDKYKEENPVDNTELDELKTKLQKAEEKELNFGKLREKAKAAGVEMDEKDAEINSLRDETKKEIAELRNELAHNSEADAIDDLTDDLEERKKIKHYMDKLSKPEDDHETYEKNLNDAYFLTTKQEVQVPDYISSAGAGNSKVPEEKLSSEQKELGSKLGITDEDLKN